MEVVVDGSTGLATSKIGTTFRQVFENLRHAVATRRRVVASIILDGETLTRERQDALANESTERFALLEVKTVDPFRLAAETLSGLGGHLTNVERMHEAASALIESDEYAKALEKLDECFHGWSLLIRAVLDVGGLVSADFEAMQTSGDTIEGHIRKLQAVVVRFKTLLDLKDLDRVPEVAQGQLRPLLADWRAVLESLAHFVAKGSAASS